MKKPYADSCDENKFAISEIIDQYLDQIESVFEIGSGTGQHAVFFGNRFSHLTWQTSDRKQYHDGIKHWIEDSGLTNVLTPVSLDVSASDWPQEEYDLVFSANTTHIMHWNDVIALFNNISGIMKPSGYFVLYGPFNMDGYFTSESNRQFHMRLTNRDPDSGIRNFNDLNVLAEKNHLILHKMVDMPHNNKILIWQKKSFK